MSPSPSDPESVEPTLKEVYRILVSIQGAVATLLVENSKMSPNIIELKSFVARSNNEVNKLKKDMNSQCKYIASLEEELARVSKKAKTQKEELEDLHVSFEELEQYTRKKRWNYMVSRRTSTFRWMDGWSVKLQKRLEST